MLRICHCLGIMLIACLASAAASAGLSITTTTFGWDPLTQQPTAIGQTALSKYPALAVNQEFVIVFNGNLDKNSIGPESARIESVPASELAPLGLSSSLPGGLTAPVIYTVKKNKLILQPAVLITNGQISFGFAPGAFYRLTLKKGQVKGAGGSLPKTIEIRFRTTDQVVDQAPGAPSQVVTLVDASAGSKSLNETKPPQLQVSFSNAEVTPAPKVRVAFNELVKPNTVVDAATNGSPTVHIQIDADGLGSTTTDRTTVPGTFTLVSSQKASTLNWQPLLEAVPGNSIYVVTIDPLIEDLVGNSVYGLTGDIGAQKSYAFKTKPTGTVNLNPIVEPFTTQAKFDSGASSADWGLSVPGFLISGPGGGTGEDGAFIAGSTTVILPTSQIVLSQEVPRVYNFSEFTVPPGVTVRGQGPFPLIIRSTGPVTINGTIDVSGETPISISPSQFAPGLAGAPAAGGGGGGLGGSVTLGEPSFLPTMVNIGIPGYAPTANPGQGLSGQVANVTDYSAVAGLVGPLIAQMADANNAAATIGLFVQSNVGTGASPVLFPNASPGGAIQHLHPLFKVKAFSGPTSGSLYTIGIQDDTNAIDYAGTLLQPGLDLYELPPPPITKIGDPIVFGDLSGHDGEETGFAGTRGRGSVGLTVAQNFITQVRSGGGGGGGGRGVGEAGEDSPTFGTAEGTSGGTGGSGVITATIASATPTTITAVGSPFAGLTLGPGVDPDVTPAAIVFPVITSSYEFEIVSNTASTLTIKPIALLQATGADTNSDKILNISDVAGVTGGVTMRVESSMRIGGGGGGGSGVHLAGTAKTSLPDPSSPGNSLISLPKWTPGVGGGAGGGSVIIEAADRIGVAAGGQILARGGVGGRTTGPLATSASGGGGGGGGTIVLRSTDITPFAVTVSGLVDANGGAGGLGFVEGGGGGDGRVRFENRAGSLNASQYVNNSVVPTLTATDLGYLIPGLSPTVALSKFFLSGAINVQYTGFTVLYKADVDGVPQSGLSFSLADLQGGGQAPFTIAFNDAGMTSNGNVDPATIDLNFVEDPTSLTGGYVRFRIELEGSKVIAGHTYENIEIDQVTITVAAQ